VCPDEWFEQLDEWKEKYRFQYRRPGPVAEGGDGQGVSGDIKTQQAIEALYTHVDTHSIHEDVRLRDVARPQSCRRWPERGLELAACLHCQPKDCDLSRLRR
jgi:hypothetical protein